MKFVKPTFAILFLISQASVGQESKPDAASHRLTLEESISLAIKGGTTVLKASSNDQVQSTQLLQGYLQFLPNLSAQGAYNYSKGTTYLTSAAPTLVDGSSHGPNYVISTTLNIFNGFSDIAAWNASRERKRASEKTLFRTKQQISLDVAQTYLQVVLDQKLIKIAEKNLKASKDREELLQEQTNVGLRNKSDLFRQIAQTSSDESFLITVQNRRQDDQILMLRKLRINPDTSYEFVEPPLEDQVTKLEKNASNLNEEDSIHQALEQRRDYEVAKLNAEAAHHDITSFRSTYFPRLDFVASYLANARTFDYEYVAGTNTVPATQGSLSNQLSNQTSYFYGIVLTWDIFDRWSNALNVERAKSVAYKADIDSEDFRNQVIGEMKQAISDYRATIAQLGTSQRGLVAAQKAYEVSEGRYEVGQLSYVDLAAAQTALVQAEANRAQALIGYELQRRSIDFALGITQVD